MSIPLCLVPFAIFPPFFQVGFHMGKSNCNISIPFIFLEPSLGLSVVALLACYTDMTLGLSFSLVLHSSLPIPTPFIFQSFPGCCVFLFLGLILVLMMLIILELPKERYRGSKFFYFDILHICKDVFSIFIFV